MTLNDHDPTNNNITTKPKIFETPIERVTRPKKPKSRKESVFWHQSLNYAQSQSIKTMAPNRETTVFSHITDRILSKITCSSCFPTNLPPAPHERTHHVLRGALSSNTCGPMPAEGITGGRHFVSFLDAVTRFATAIPFVSRSEKAAPIEATLHIFRRDFGRTPGILISSNASEYV